MISRLRLTIFALCVCLLFLSSGCHRFGKFVEKRADKAALNIIEQTQFDTLGQSNDFTIDIIESDLYNRVLQESERVSLDDSGYTPPSLTLGLSDALAIAFARSRDYQSRKESLFNDALDLTDTRYNFGLEWSLSGSASANKRRTGYNAGIDPSTEKFGTSSLAAGVKKTFFTGATISLRLTQNFTRYWTNEPRPGGTSTAALSVVQPLLRGAGSLVAHEPLRQAERNMVYSVRQFSRYEKEFAIGIISQYFNLLSALDSLQNQRLDYETAVFSAERSAAWAEAGRSSELEADQARQRVLSARNSWNEQQARYEERLDRFKIGLGLPVALDIGPDQKELTALAERGLVWPDMKLPQAVEQAEEKRLDLKTLADEVADRERAVKIALRNFLPKLDLGFNASMWENREKNRPFPTRWSDNQQSVSIDWGLPLDWTPRRNRYRKALISLEAAKRNLEQSRDEVLLEVKNAWRQLEFQRKRYEIQRESVKLAERRVESALLLQEMGKAVQRDVTEAQEALLDARNGETSALVDYTIQRLEFWHAIEALEIDVEDMWYM
jgi:outer membrane protein TolC